MLRAGWPTPSCMAYDPDGLNLIQNNGVVAGQKAPHFHMHVVPRRKVGGDWGNGPLTSRRCWRERLPLGLNAMSSSAWNRSTRLLA